VSTVRISFPTIALLLVPSLAAAQPAPEGQRTVSYYRDNPYVREKVLEQCANDPGHLQFNPDCVNAKKGDIADAARKGEGMFFKGKVPSPEYFSWNHQARSQVLTTCRNITPQRRASYGTFCDAAQASIESDQRRQTGTLPQVAQIR
jgi:hypothetical protein